MRELGKGRGIEMQRKGHRKQGELELEGDTGETDIKRREEGKT